LLLLALNPPLCSWVLDLLLTTAGSDPLQSNRWHHAASSLRGRVQSPVIVFVTNPKEMVVDFRTRGLSSSEEKLRRQTFALVCHRRLQFDKTGNESQQCNIEVTIACKRPSYHPSSWAFLLGS
ncbi:hypothetical protein XENORESO_019767, partial [Xenotaenia resolanae]